MAYLPMEGVLRAQTLGHTRGFMKALVDESDRIVGFTAFGPEAGEVLGTIHLAMLARLPYTMLRDAAFTHPTMIEGLKPLFSSGRQPTAAGMDKPESVQTGRA
jgi:pyruvate/2-oxoglutarate dehydrogenase complex dihydrolipoamide dehydrogenase (E3) component